MPQTPTNSPPSPAPTASPGVDPPAQPDSVEPLSVTSIDASSATYGSAANLVDHDLTTRWASCGKGESVTLDFGRAETIYEVDIAFYQPQSSIYAIEIEVSSDVTRQKWTPSLAGQSNGSNGMQSFKLNEPESGRFVRIVGDGNSGPQSCVNSYEEVSVLGVPYFRADMETGDSSSFSELECPTPSRQFQVVSSPTRQGQYAARFEEGPGDVWAGNGSVRCLAINGQTNESAGDDYYYALSLYFPSAVTNNLLWELHTRPEIYEVDDALSVVPLAIMAYGARSDYSSIANRLSLRLNSGAAVWDGSRWTGWSTSKPDLPIMSPIRLDTWIDLIVHVKFSETDGAVQVWGRVKGQPWPARPQVQELDTPTLQYIPGGLDPAIPDTVHVSSLYDALGLYKGGGLASQTDVVYMDNYVVASSFGAAAATLPN